MRKKTTDYSLISSGWFDEDLIVPPSGANNYSLNLGVVTYALTLESVAFGVGLPLAEVSYALTLEGTTLSVGHTLNLGTVTDAHTAEAVAFGVGMPLGATSYALTVESVTFIEGPVLSAGTASYALTLENVTFNFVPGSGTVTTPTETPAGRKRRTRYILRVDGQEFTTQDLNEVHAILSAAKSLALKHAQAVSRAAKAPEQLAAIKLPEISGNRAARKVIEAARIEIKAIYESALRDAEIAMWIEVIKRADEAEDSILLLM